MEARRVDGKFKVNFNTPTPRRLVDLLPEVRAEDLNERNLQRRNLAVHEDARQVELDLEADVDLRGASYCDSCPPHDAVGGFMSNFEVIRTASRPRLARNGSKSDTSRMEGTAGRRESRSPG